MYNEIMKKTKTTKQGEEYLDAATDAFVKGLNKRTKTI